ncbi:hypothetical protein FOZ61_003146, partial [Perkinsus olseni]
KELASLNTIAMELNYIPNDEEEVVVTDKALEAMGEKGLKTSASLKAVCLAGWESREDIQENPKPIRFLSAKGELDSIRAYGPGPILLGFASRLGFVACIR